MIDNMNNVNERMDLTGIWSVRADDDCFGIGGESPGGNGWREITIPCTFEHCLPELIGFQGTCWFMKRFVVPVSMKYKRVSLSFQAVNYHAAVWVNGRYAGSNDEGFLPFDIHVSELLNYGSENSITVRANNCTAAGELPPVHFWRSQGGIVRKVELVASSWVYIKDIRITAQPQGGEGLFKAAMTLRNEQAHAVQADVTVRVNAVGTQGPVLVCCKTIGMEPGAAFEVVLEDLVPSVNLWWPDSPFLYSASVELSIGGENVDNRLCRFGFRTVGVQDGKVLLNGKQVFFNGFNRHEDYPDTRLPIDSALVRQDFLNIKASGANFVRMCHYPHDSTELDLCDELGLLVMDEIPLCALLVGIPGIDIEEARHALLLSLEHARAQLRRLIARDFNHPSVIFWSVSNETNEQEPGVMEINIALMQLARKLDPSRLTMHVSMEPYWTSDAMDRLFDCDDVICINGYAPLTERIHKHNENYSPADAMDFWAHHSARLSAAYPGKPVFVTEFGYQTGYWQDGDDDEEMQARMISMDYAAMRPYVCGALVWCYADHAWPLQWPSRSPVFDRDISMFGVVTRDRRKRRAFDAYKKLIENEWN